ncbi:stealth family protein [Winogradskyella ursingii]|uniref:stealth family protein n=1 Tax=Winogradskyella ursingii TaxID=2686079 RepID=UPI0015CDAA9F|nr:stealth family protein [Winogradskyella ursingii]
MQKTATQSHDTELPIDAVISWVDGNDEEHQKKMLPYLEDTKKIESKKFRTRFDQVNEIKYTVDSILKFAPFIRNIFIITDQQIPDFLKNNNAVDIYKNVTIIDHKTIFSGYEEYLPTFSSRSIESFMFRIPALADHFIYLNDDFFLINEVKPTDFFINGQPVLRGKWLKFEENIFYKKLKAPKVSGHKAAQQRAAKLAGFNKYYNFKHTPHPFRKTTFQQYFQENEDLFIDNIKYRFRSNHQFLFQGLINHLEIKNKTCVLKDDLQLIYFRSYKKPLFWYKFKLNIKSKGNLFLGLQGLDQCPPNILEYILQWLKDRTN